MKVHFLAPHPLFGRKTAPLPLKEQERSPYYWWWAFLRRSEAYIKCCEKGGKGPLANLYGDFGDVRSDDFRQWWTEDNRGPNLCGEKGLSVRFGPLAGPEDWHPSWTSEKALVIAIPLNMNKRKIKSLVSNLIESRIESRRGRKALRDAHSTATYPLARNYSARNLGKALEIYDMWIKSKTGPKEEKLYLWEIGVAARLNKIFVKNATSKDKHDRYVGRNNLNASVLRYVREAQKHIAGVEKGIFPAV